MIINSIKLKNIRSYADAEIGFPEGTVLLSGDIGSGKTSVLLALEFAVFGIMKGLVNGSSLLRHGADSGFVELCFSLGKKKITIRRSLKRTSSGVSQEPGFLKIDDVVVRGSAQELKARVLDLLGYPETLLNKSKSLVFRYTVFTPQEEMKRILYEKQEERLDILRKLFDIDKYKRIKDNALSYARELRSRMSALQGRLELLPGKQDELEELKQEIKGFKSQASELKLRLEKADNELKEMKKRYDSLSSEYEHLISLEKEYSVAESRQESLRSELKRAVTESDSLKEQTEQLSEELKGFEPGSSLKLSDELNEKKAELEKLNNKMLELSSKKSGFSNKLSDSEDIINKISSMDQCPVCEQKVTAEHIDKVREREQQKINECNAKLKKLAEIKQKLDMKKQVLNKHLDELAEKARTAESKKARIESLEEKKKKKAELEKRIQESGQSLKELESKLSGLKQELDKGRGKKQEMEQAKQEREQKEQKKNQLDKELVEKQTRLKSLEQQSEKIKQEINKLKQDKQKLSELTKLRDWLLKEFVSLADAVEKSILTKVLNEFNAFFQEWFSTLLEDETISVHLDEYFSPIIEQNGYETWIENLSGGEKTSIALAYRLALNKVINDFMSSIKTRDLVILDEPTEGFSSEQLDRVRDVLNQLSLRQTIIVSHEAKMEGFVDSIIRIAKQGHESRVVQ